MKPIAIHVPEEQYQEMKSLAKRRRRPVAELIREAMLEYLDREGRRQRSVLDLPSLPGGRRLRKWTRSEIADEMMGS